MPVVADDLFVASAVAFGRSGDAAADGAQVGELLLFGAIAVSQAMETVAEGLVYGCGFAHTLPTGQLARESDGRRILDVEGHQALHFFYQIEQFYPTVVSLSKRRIMQIYQT